jgi:hypothetical protein
MAKPLVVALPPNLTLWGDCTISVTALNPSTGAVVSGVSISNVTLEVDQTEGLPDDLAVGPFMLVPGPGG